MVDSSFGSVARGAGSKRPSPGKRVERKQGFGFAAASGPGTGDAHAETFPESMGCAVAISEGPGNSLAIVADRAFGSASAWSGYTGGAEALVEAGATGSASATAKASGKAIAKVAAKAAGNATVRSLGAGTAQAAILAGGDVFLDSAGPGNIEVEHHGSGLLEAQFEAPAALRLVNRYPGRVHCHFARDGRLLVRRGQESDQFLLSPAATAVEIDPRGQVLMAKEVTRAVRSDAGVESAGERAGDTSDSDRPRHEF